MPETLDLSFSTAVGRWSRFGPYYAMFPLPFVSEVIRLYAKPGTAVIDPFCGRGTVPFLAMEAGVDSIAADVNPVAWIYSKTKTDPHPQLHDVKRRIQEVREAITSEDYGAENEFQELAFCTEVLGFINASRRELDWRNSRLDRTVAAFLIQHLHDKRGHGLSNQLRHSRAMSPGYCVRWWRANGYERPPEVEAHTYLQRRVEWRYAKGIVRTRRSSRPKIELGSSCQVLPEADAPAELVLTSPPYCNVTNYRSDNWLRLWALNEGPSLPDWEPSQKYVDESQYRTMLAECFGATLNRTSPQAVWYVRSDARPKTRQAITSVLDGLLTCHRRYERNAPYKSATQTALYGDTSAKPGEIDLLYLPTKDGKLSKRRRGFTSDFSRASESPAQQGV